MQGFVPISGKRQSWEELRKEVMFNNEFDTSNLFNLNVTKEFWSIITLVQRYILGTGN